MTAKGLIKLNASDIPVGTPILWTIFDEDGNVACRPGFVFRQREELLTMTQSMQLFRAEAKAGVASAPVAASKKAPISDTEESETTLDEISLHIGESWQLQLLSDFEQRRYYVKLVGYMKGTSVIVTTPTQDNRALLIREGQVFIVRAFSGKSAYAFKTSVLKSMGAPFPYLHLAYPETVRGMIVRQNQRIMVSIITVIIPRREGLNKASGMIRNVSKSGASLQTRANLGQSGDRTNLAFQLNIEGNDYLLSIEAIIRAIRPPGPNGGDLTEFGFQFLDVKPIDQLVLTAYVNSLIANTDTA